MNDYIIVMDPVNGPHLEHKSHKYISRKWKNGRWVYTYPSDKTTSRYDENIKNAKFNREWATSAASNIVKDYNNRINKNSTLGQRDQDILRVWQKIGVTAARAQHENEAQKASYLRNKYKDEVKKWESTPISKIQTFVNKGIDKVKSLVSSIQNKLSKKKKVTNTGLSSPNGKILKENVIKENVIKENVIKENTIKPITIKEAKVTTYDNSKKIKRWNNK